MKDKLPFDLRGNLGCTAQRLQRLLPQLGIQYHEGWVICEEGSGLEIWRGWGFQESRNGGLEFHC